MMLFVGIKAPALIVVASQDVMPVEHAIKLSRMIAGAQLMVLPGVHGACLGEVTANAGSQQAEAMALLVQEFLNEKVLAAEPFGIAPDDVQGSNALCSK